MIQLYGRFDGYWSHAGVSRGMANGLHRNGVPLRVANVEHGPPYIDLDEGIEFGCDPYAKVGVYIGGYPFMAHKHLHHHKLKIALFIAESAVIPYRWAMEAERCHLVMVPSWWTRNAFEQAGLRGTGKLMVVPHGVDDVFLADPDGVRSRGDRIRMLHICGAARFPDRKGTPQLVEAFTWLFGTGAPFAHEAELTIRTPSTPYMQELVQQAQVDGAWVCIDDSKEALPPAEMLALMEQHDVIVQPSRAEAYGIVPCEARALCKPLIVTHCAGHADHAHKLDWLVKSGEDKPIASNFVPNGCAPEVNAAAISLALSTYARSGDGKYPIYTPYPKPPSWQEVTREAAQAMKELL